MAIGRRQSGEGTPEVQMTIFDQKVEKLSQIVNREIPLPSYQVLISRYLNPITRELETRIQKTQGDSAELDALIERVAHLFQRLAVECFDRFETSQYATIIRVGLRVLELSRKPDANTMSHDHARLQLVDGPPAILESSDDPSRWRELIGEGARNLIDHMRLKKEDLK